MMLIQCLDMIGSVRQVTLDNGVYIDLCFLLPAESDYLKDWHHLGC